MFKQRKFQELDKKLEGQLKGEFKDISKKVSSVLLLSGDLFDGALIAEPLIGPEEFRNTFANLSREIEISSRLLGRIRMVEVQLMKVMSLLKAAIYAEFPKSELRNDDMRKAKMQTLCPKTVRMAETLEVYKDGLQAHIANIKLIYDITSRRLSAFELERELLK